MTKRKRDKFDRMASSGDLRVIYDEDGVIIYEVLSGASGATAANAESRTG